MALDGMGGFPEWSWTRSYPEGMAKLLTRKVEVDALLLERLGQRCQGINDRERLESTAKLFLGRKALHLMQERNTHSEESAVALGVESVRRVRREEPRQGG